MPVFFLILIVPAGISLSLAVRLSGWKRWAAWGNFALLALPVLVGGTGGMLLSAGGLAWRSCVKLPCALSYVAGILMLLVWAGEFLWRQIAWWKPVIREIGHCVILAAVALLLLVLGWYGLLFGAIWAGSDREVVIREERMVEEQSWMDWDYYAYHGPLTRGSKRIYSSWELSREDFGETENWK